MKTFYIFLKYLVYAAFTQDERLRYAHGKIEGMHCLSIDRRGFMGEDIHFRYDPNRKPEREYLTWKEYRDYQNEPDFKDSAE